MSVKECLQILQKLAKRQSLNVFLVGGYLRNLHLKQDSVDLDFTVCRNALVLAKRFATQIKGAYVVLDQDRGSARVVRRIAGIILTFDFADYRSGTLKGDLKKRDFTVNTLCLELEKVLEPDLLPHIKDFLGAVSDLREKRIRMVSDGAFRDDPLRLLRAYSLRSQTGFRIEAKTVSQIRKDRALIGQVSPERIREELFKIFESSRTYESLKALKAVGLLFEVIPQLRLMEKVHQGGYHHLNVLNHSFEAVKQFEGIIKELQDPEVVQYLNELVAGGHSRRALIKLACLLHDIGKPETKKKEPGGRTSFHGHEHAGDRLVRVVAKELLLSSRETHVVRDMVLYHLRPGYLCNFKRPSDKAIFRFFRDAGEETAAILLLSMADQRATRGPLTTQGDLKHHDAICRGLLSTWFEKKKEKPFVRIINGHDLIRELNIKPGPVFAVLLAAIEEAQHLGKIVTRKQALDLARQVLKTHQTQGNERESLQNRNRGS